MKRKDSATKALEETYPQIKKEAKINNADIWWADEQLVYQCHQI